MEADLPLLCQAQLVPGWAIAVLGINALQK